MRWSLVLTLGICSLPAMAQADCCQLVKLESEPSATRVRVCDAADGEECAEPRYDGDVTFGAPVAICASAASVSYRELDPVSGAWAAPVTARCDGSTDVEL